MNKNMENDENEDNNEKKQFIDGLNEYYKLKSQYENNINKDKNQIIKLKGLSWKEKRIEYQKIKPKCINCKRPVGTIFTTKIENSTRHLIAICGDRITPCPLNINICLGDIHDISLFIQEDEKDIDKYKRNIIKDKNDLLFGYIDSEEAVSKFDSINEEVAKTTKIYEYALEKYLNIVDNPEKKMDLEKKQVEFYNNLDNFNFMINEYKNTQNIQFINDAVQLYKDAMIPKLREITKLKYSYLDVEYDEADDVYYFIQKLIAFEDIEIDLSETGQKVLSMKMGELPTKRKAQQTQAPPSIITAAIPDINEIKMKRMKRNKVVGMERKILIQKKI
jgi:hypothetical protein